MATPPKRRALDATGEKVLRYEAFISDVLQRDLQKVLDHRDKVYEQLSKYLQLRNVIERLQEAKHSELYMQVDLGCNFFVDTVVSDTSRIYVALGYGFFLELTLAEALKFIDRKSNLLTEGLENCKACRISRRRLIIDFPPLQTLKSLNAFLSHTVLHFPPNPYCLLRCPVSKAQSY
ncbi:protein UXT isoform X1 [Myotis daubentonii]|uniref:protein UXT isoform X1 n=1 Tax=Myotis daubentonii TaxID=98922 RepID=UPI002872D70F|nr:protein UXT isoform X1 [Myotis daubentonii]